MPMLSKQIPLEILISYNSTAGVRCVRVHLIERTWWESQNRERKREMKNVYKREKKNRTVVLLLQIIKDYAI